MGSSWLLFYVHDYGRPHFGPGTPYIDPAVVIYCGAAPTGSEFNPAFGHVPKNFQDFIGNAHRCYGSLIGLRDGVSYLTGSMHKALTPSTKDMLAKVAQTNDVSEMREVAFSALGYCLAVKPGEKDRCTCVLVDFKDPHKIQTADFWELIDFTFQTSLIPPAWKA
ncbi:hypothetical protein DLJ54_00655 [Corynebacterium heidelbergense]|uniref:Uncharacterized protein n=2 Tax=Corynebacterium heidelbergense TaxID=2055947 RepID=A0A364V8R9_9CORY|nr:hypothetical protein DLJ54_00655 [Corynebacterium heidelbergense]